jgi:hypothetical protein
MKYWPCSLPLDIMSGIRWVDENLYFYLEVWVRCNEFISPSGKLTLLRLILCLNRSDGQSVHLASHSSCWYIKKALLSNSPSSNFQSVIRSFFNEVQSTFTINYIYTWTVGVIKPDQHSLNYVQFDGDMETAGICPSI